MRWLSIVVLAACSKQPERPPTGEFMAMTADQQCDATAPRAMQCTDELIVAALDQLIDDKSDVAALEAGFREADAQRHDRTDRDEARMIHDNNCLGERKAAYQRRVFDCWNQPSCEAFASCVYPSGTH